MQLGIIIFYLLVEIKTNYVIHLHDYIYLGNHGKIKEKDTLFIL
jgi:hypothetical protein